MNTRDLGIGAGKGDKSRVTSVEAYRERFPKGMGPKRLIVRSTCCECAYIITGNVTNHHKCLRCGNACDVRIFEIT